MAEEDQASGYLDKSRGVVAVEVAKNEAILLWDAEVRDAAPDELVGGHFLILLHALLVGLGAGDAQQVAGLEGVVELHERVAPAEGPPQQSDGIGVVVGFVLLLGHPALEAGDGAQAHLQVQTSLEERGVLVGALVEDVVRGLDGAAIDGRRGLAEEGRGRGGLSALGVAHAAVRVARVLALEALVGHEGGRPSGGRVRGNPRVCRGWRGRGNRRVGAHQS